MGSSLPWFNFCVNCFLFVRFGQLFAFLGSCLVRGISHSLVDVFAFLPCFLFLVFFQNLFSVFCSVSICFSCLCFFFLHSAAAETQNPVGFPPGRDAAGGDRLPRGAKNGKTSNEGGGPKGEEGSKGALRGEHLAQPLLRAKANFEFTRLFVLKGPHSKSL